MESKRIFILGTIGLLFIGVLLGMSKPRYEEVDSDVEYNMDMVPDSATAVQLAEILLKRTFDSLIADANLPKIDTQKPFHVKLKNEVWTISANIGLKMGGGPYIKIDKKTCKVLKIAYSK